MSLTLTLKDNGGNPVSGEGSSITLNGTTESSFTKFDLYGDTEQTTYSGKNKLNYYANYQVGYSTTINGVTYTMLADGGIKMQGKNNTSSNSSFTVVGSSWEGTTIQVPLDSSVTYMSSIGRPSNTYRWYVRGMGSGGSVITLNSNNNAMSFSGCTGITYVMLQVVPNAEVDGIVYPMVEIGSQATSFEPYVGGTASPNPDYPQEVQNVTGEQTITVSNGTESQSYPINLGKNLYQSIGITTASGGLTSTVTEDGKLHITGTATGNSSNFAGTMTTNLPAGTYTFSLTKAMPFRILLRSNDNQNHWVIEAGQTKITQTITSPLTSLWVWGYQLVSDTTYDETVGFMLEKGSIATSFAPYFTPIELCKIGDYQDYIYKSGDDWYIHKETNKVVLNGTENWTNSSTAGYPYIRGLLNGFAPAGSSCYCNMFTPRTGSHVQYEYIWVQPSSGVLYLQVSDNRLSEHTLLAFEAWLGTNKPVVYCVLATPTDTQITNATLISQLEALYNTAHSYNGQTVITSSSQYLPAIMDVTVRSSINEVMYTETELSNPLTITDIEGKSQNTTLNGNIYVDYVYNKKSFSVSIFNLKASDYATIRGFYDRQFTLNEFPLLSIPELNISEMPVFFEIGSREINSQCIVTDKLTLKFRETAQQ